MNHVQVSVKIQKEEREKKPMPYSFHSFNKPCLTGAAYSVWTTFTRQHLSSPSKGIWMHSSHWGERQGKEKKKQYTLPKALDHISHTATTSSSINCYNSFDVPDCCYIAASHRIAVLTLRAGQSNTLKILELLIKHTKTRPRFTRQFLNSAKI